jgi:hypothetical protein
MVHHLNQTNHGSDNKFIYDRSTLVFPGINVALKGQNIPAQGNALGKINTMI